MHTLSAKRSESRKSKNKREQKQIMSNKLSNQFLQTITSKENKNLTLYAILDAARSSNIYMQIDEVEHYNLFEGEEAQLLEEVAGVVLLVTPIVLADRGAALVGGRAGDRADQLPEIKAMCDQVLGEPVEQRRVGRGTG